MNEAEHFNSGEYRIINIELEDGLGSVTNLYAFPQHKRAQPTVLRFGEPFRLRVKYECMLPDLPDTSCGVAAALTLAGRVEHVMYFNTNYPHSDAEITQYSDADFR